LSSFHPKKQLLRAVLPVCGIPIVAMAILSVILDFAGSATLVSGYSFSYVLSIDDI